MDSWSRHTRIIGIPENRHQLEDRSEFLHHTSVEHVKELLLNRPRNASIRWLLTRRVSHCQHIRKRWSNRPKACASDDRCLQNVKLLHVLLLLPCWCFSFTDIVTLSNKRSFPHSPSSFIISRYSLVSRSSPFVYQILFTMNIIHQKRFINNNWNDRWNN